MLLFFTDSKSRYHSQIDNTNPRCRKKVSSTTASSNTTASSSSTASASSATAALEDYQKYAKMQHELRIKHMEEQHATKLQYLQEEHELRMAILRKKLDQCDTDFEL